MEEQQKGGIGGGAKPDEKKAEQPIDDRPASVVEGSKPITVVMSKLESELAAEREHVKAQLEAEKLMRAKEKRKRTLTISLTVIGIVIVVGGLVFLILTNLGGNRIKDRDPDKPEGEAGVVLSTIEGYKCTTTNCAKATDLTENTILVQDEAYYVYDRTTGGTVRTTIDEGTYRSFTPFFWGDQLLLVLERATGRQGLYSITGNRGLTEAYNYESFSRDINSEVYAGMKWIEGRYILASASSEVRLIDVMNGNEIVRASVRIFVDRDFIIGFHGYGDRRIYTMTGTRFLVDGGSMFLAIYDHHVFQSTGKTNVEIYDTNGEKLKHDTDYYKSFKNERLKGVKVYQDAISGWDGVFVIPAN